MATRLPGDFLRMRGVAPILATFALVAWFALACFSFVRLLYAPSK